MMMSIRRFMPLISKVDYIIRGNVKVAALRTRKSKSDNREGYHYCDSKIVRATGGKGGDGMVSFLQLWCNERAGPDGGDGGNGGHVIFQASSNVRNLNHVMTPLRAEDGGRGSSKECHGKNAKHTFVKVPVGTVIRNDQGHIIGDLDRPEVMFVAARGGGGGKGNRFFTTTTENSPKICEYGPPGEDITYTLELRSMADIGLIGLPNAGKSTLLSAISRANPKIAPFAFTTLRPNIGIVQYDDHTQLAVADLPGLIPGSHKNKGLGIKFLKHAERCLCLVYVVDASCVNPWLHYDQIQTELRHFSKKLAERPQIIVANKMDQPESEENLSELQRLTNIPVIPISAKMGTNLSSLLSVMREQYEKYNCKMNV